MKRSGDASLQIIVFAGYLVYHLKGMRVSNYSAYQFGNENGGWTNKALQLPSSVLLLSWEIDMMKDIERALC